MSPSSIHSTSPHLSKGFGSDRRQPQRPRPPWRGNLRRRQRYRGKQRQIKSDVEREEPTAYGRLFVFKSFGGTGKLRSATALDRQARRAEAEEQQSARARSGRLLEAPEPFVVVVVVVVVGPNSKLP
jgi:hypothetical protein